ncbi:TRAF3-interacting protein 1 isoform X2 [Clupea harengus]|uniref:TRAF3-interacting protein 1 n=1 Tax=Clupea harengus TaxID=7950 RepID=A0A6P8EUV5_CLUHA|nr:TRAF3-interacting protein 1 isoform X2 [Clupea harengus]
MNGAMVKKTQDTLGKVIKKPPLTEKLLNKPPFRYLHDILSEVIRTTGFLKGLYAEAEMKSDNVKEKDSKILFLQKAIDVVMLVSGEPLSAKPARIVAGHEPEKTNELLQVLGKCCLNKSNSDEAVKRVLAGEKVDLKVKASSSSKSQDKENREGRDRHRDREVSPKQEKKEIKESSQSRAPKDPDQPREQEARRTEKERHREGDRAEKGRERDRTKDRDKDKSRDRDKDRARDKDKERERERDREKEKDKDRERDKDKDKEKEKDREAKAKERGDVPRERERRRERSERHKDTQDKPKEQSERKVKAAEEVRPKLHPEEPTKIPKKEPEESSPMPETESEEPTEVFENQSPARIPRPSSAKGQRRWPKAGGPEESDSEGAPPAERPVQLENGDTTDAAPPHPAHRRIPRPSSARPAPPRVKRQESYTEVIPAERLGSAKPTAVIIEGKKLSEDEEEDDEQFVVEETAPVPSDMPDLQAEAVELQGDENHGGLVKKILETKKDFETTPSSPKSNPERTLVSEAARRKERELVAREIERLRSSIQTVCRSALPLGKIMDYIQEDMDAMQIELQSWRRENKEHAQALLQEQRITDSAVEPLKAELVELEQLIRDQQDKICAVKSNILRNEEKIQKMVFSINFSSQT